MNQVLCGDALEMLKTLPDETVRDSKGRFVKGNHYGAGTEFKRGEHWRPQKPYWSKEWLESEYISQRKSAGQIAGEQGCDENNILYFLKKHGINSRSMSEIRKAKKWGAAGENNPMFGRRGELNPHWNGGGSPERQRIYASIEWKRISKAILKRDGHQCRQCGTKPDKDNKLHIHHIKPFSRYPEMRLEAANLLTLCNQCHKEIHGRRKSG